MATAAEELTAKLIKAAELPAMGYKQVEVARALRMERGPFNTWLRTHAIGLCKSRSANQVQAAKDWLAGDRLPKCLKPGENGQVKGGMSVGWTREQERLCMKLLGKGKTYPEIAAEVSTLGPEKTKWAIGAKVDRWRKDGLISDPPITLAGPAWSCPKGTRHVGEVAA